ncbi:MAG: glycine zipper domain-containing protein [Candidatus Nitrosotenuis sp.]
MTGCATYGGYQPTVDVAVDRNPQYIQQDIAECRELAQNASSTGKNAVMGVGTGALLGAATGAALGAVVGNPATGAALGAAAGGIGGGANAGMDADNQFRRAYINCMRGRGHSVID